MISALSGLYGLLIQFKQFSQQFTSRSPPYLAVPRYVISIAELPSVIKLIFTTWLDKISLRTCNFTGFWNYFLGDIASICIIWHITSIQVIFSAISINCPCLPCYSQYNIRVLNCHLLASNSSSLNTAASTYGSPRARATQCPIGWIILNQMWKINLGGLFYYVKLNSKNILFSWSSGKNHL